MDVSVETIMTRIDSASEQNSIMFKLNKVDRQALEDAQMSCFGEDREIVSLTSEIQTSCRFLSEHLACEAAVGSENLKLYMSDSSGREWASSTLRISALQV